MTVPTEPAAPGPAARRRRRRQRWLIAGSALVIAAGTATTVLLTRIEADATAAPPATPPATPTATVVRTDLINTDLAAGTLSYGPETTVPGQQQGTLTWLPAPGTVIACGRRLYAVDARPVVLFCGDTPLYRTLGPAAVTGPDVRVLTENLTAFGFYHGKPGEKFTTATAAAVRAWQKSLGLDQTGAVGPADVAVLAGPVRVSGANGQVGDRVAGDTLKITGTDREVTVDLDTGKQAEAVPNAKVAITLPDNSNTTGTITGVGAVATAKPGASGITIPITIRLNDPGAAGSLVSAPVGVTFTAGERRGVLAVPVGALLALREGGYAVEVVEPGGAHRLVGVRTGEYADGMVEVTGAVRVGMTVVTVS